MMSVVDPDHGIGATGKEHRLGVGGKCSCCFVDGGREKDRHTADFTNRSNQMLRWQPQPSPRLLPDFSQTSLGGARGHDANAKEIGSVDDDFVQTWLGVGVLRMVTQNTSDTDVARPLAIRGNDVPRCIVS